MVIYEKAYIALSIGHRKVPMQRDRHSILCRIMHIKVLPFTPVNHSQISIAQSF